MKHTSRILPLFAIVLVMAQCTTPSFHVPSAQIPGKAWRPGDVGEVETLLLIYKMNPYHYLRDARSFEQSDALAAGELAQYGIIGRLRPGEQIKVTECRRYPMSTVDGLEVRGVVIQGPYAGLKVNVSSPLCNAVGEFWGPNPEFIRRVQDASE